MCVWYNVWAQPGIFQIPPVTVTQALSPMTWGSVYQRLLEITRDYWRLLEITRGPRVLAPACWHQQTGSAGWQRPLRYPWHSNATSTHRVRQVRLEHLHLQCNLHVYRQLSHICSMMLSSSWSSSLPCVTSFPDSFPAVLQYAAKNAAGEDPGKQAVPSHHYHHHYHQSSPSSSSSSSSSSYHLIISSLPPSPSLPSFHHYYHHHLTMIVHLHIILERHWRENTRVISFMAHFSWCSTPLHVQFDQDGYHLWDDKYCWCEALQSNHTS